jgi:hypothetical protein
MKEDYLWDKTGEPDQQIQELEEILGTLRYKPRPLVIPADLLVTRRRNYRPLLAIAATVLLALMAAGVWLSLRKSESRQPEIVKSDVKTPNQTPGPQTPNTPPENVSGPKAPDTVEPKRQREVIAHNAPRRPRVKKAEPEAEAAKEQIMLALRLASEKLNVASRRTQSTPNPLRNQHKIG